MTKPPADTKVAKSRPDGRKARLAVALRANIARRKAQLAARDGKDENKNNNKDGQD